MEALEDMVKLGSRQAWVLASGFAEIGSEGQLRQKKLRDFCLEHQIALCGPNCVGFANFQKRAGAYSAPLSEKVKRGGLALIAHSGSIVIALTNSLTEIGFSLVVSSGNEAVLDTADYLNYLVDDESTEVIGLFQEQLRRPEAFSQACLRAAENNKPIVALKIGSSQKAQTTVSSHTGSMAGSARVGSAFFKKYGVIEVLDLNELLETSKTLLHTRKRPPKGTRLGSTTVSGGEIGLLCDMAEHFGLTFPVLSQSTQQKAAKVLPNYVKPENPMDAFCNGDISGAYTECLTAMALDANVDMVVVSQDAPLAMSPPQIEQYAQVAQAAVQAAQAVPEKPLILISHIGGGLEPALTKITSPLNLPYLQGTKEGLKALRAAYDYAKFREGLKVEHGSASSPVRMALNRSDFDLPPYPHSLGPPGPLKLATRLALAKHYGLSLIKGFLAQDEHQVLEAAAQLGYPVALKLESPEAPHKSELNLVALNLTNAHDLSQALGQMEERAAAKNLTLDAFWVQAMAPASWLEMIVGLQNDPVYGPALLLALGGLAVELFSQPVLAMAPLDAQSAQQLIDALPQAPLFHGYRNLPPKDCQALADFISKLSLLAFDLKDALASADFNPVMVGPQGSGVMAVDALMVVKA
jgi:acyl-CoA synthetase (NDP forming)